MTNMNRNDSDCGLLLTTCRTPHTSYRFLTSDLFRNNNLNYQLFYYQLKQLFMRKFFFFCAMLLALSVSAQTGKKAAPAAKAGKPNIVIIWGDDIGQTNISAYSHGVMGYKTPNIDRVAKAGVMFTDYYAEQSCTAGRASFITGQCGLRTGLTKVGLPGADVGLQKEDVTIAELLKGTRLFYRSVRKKPFG